MNGKLDIFPLELRNIANDAAQAADARDCDRPHAIRMLKNVNRLLHKADTEQKRFALQLVAEALLDAAAQESGSWRRRNLNQAAKSAEDWASRMVASMEVNGDE